MKKRTWIEINTTALQHNINTIDEYIGKNQKLGAVVKSNAYGHGLILIGQLLDNNSKISLILTAGLDEAITLRRAGIKKPILAMSYIDADERLAIEYNIQLTISNATQIKNLNDTVKNIGKKINIHLKIDTGLSRIGIPTDQAKKTIDRLLKNEQLNLVGIFTHLADNKNEEQTYCAQQLESFSTIIDYIPKQLLKNITIHAQASASLYAGPYKKIFNMVRIGSALYGMYKSPMQERAFAQNGKKLIPILSWKTNIIEIKKIPKQTPVSYGCRFITKKNTTIAIAPIGYWDGYPTALTNKSIVYIHDIPAPVIGTITMNMIIIDITHIPQANIEDTVTLIGNKKEITVTELAAHASCINIELLCRINPNIEHRLITKELDIFCDSKLTMTKISSLIDKHP